MKIKLKQKKRSFYLIATSDIAFLLLIFLVVTASFDYSQDIKPPTTPYVEELEKQYESVVIEVDESGNYALLSRNFVLEELSVFLTSISANMVIKIYADRDVDFSHITRLMDELQKNKRKNVFLMMERVKEK